MSTPFHEGEQAVQERAGVRERAEHLAERMVRAFLPDQLRQFFEQLPFVLVGSVDRSGNVWASVLSGKPGFVYTPDEHTLRVRAPMELEVGQALGMLGIELPTRRRNRVNGRVTSVDEHGFSLSVEQSYGNCPAHITVRVPRAVQVERGVEPLGALLSPSQVAWIRESDTAFIASASSATSRGENEGVDVSHRGGEPGFIEVSEQDGATVLTLPDYSGNNMFNTLGNIERYPHVGLSFPSFTSGDWLALSGRAEIVWDASEIARYPRAKRLVRITVEQGRVLRGGFPFCSG